MASRRRGRHAHQGRVRCVESFGGSGSARGGSRHARRALRLRARRRLRRLPPCRTRAARVRSAIRARCFTSSSPRSSSKMVGRSCVTATTASRRWCSRVRKPKRTSPRRSCATSPSNRRPLLLPFERPSAEGRRKRPPRRRWVSRLRRPPSPRSKSSRKSRRRKSRRRRMRRRPRAKRSTRSPSRR
jgi:hypothetical protein